MGRGVTGSKFVPSIKNIVREICISSCEGKFPGRDNRVPKCDVIENEICEIMGFVKIF